MSPQGRGEDSVGQWNEDLISLEQARTLDGLFYERVKRTPNGIAYRNYDREYKQWYELTWADVERQVARSRLCSPSASP